MSSTIFLVESTIRRKNGSHPFMPPTDKYPQGKQYHFEPRSNDDPRHLAEVDCIVHLQRFASIEGFQIVDAPAPLTAPGPAVGKEGGEAGGGASLPNPAETTPEPQTAAPAATDPAPAVTHAAEPDGFPEDMDALRALFEAEVGRQPSHRALRETMITQIEAMRASKAM